MNWKNNCNCGCGEIIENPDNRGRIRQFIRGHNSKRRTVTWGGKISETNKKKNIIPPIEFWFKKNNTPWNKDKHYSLVNSGQFKIGQNKGDKNVNWKGGISELYKTLRQSLEYKKWRKDVYRRDNYTCQLCDKIGGMLNAHHIRKWSEYPKLRFDINNGITYCEKCHIKIHEEIIHV